MELLTSLQYRVALAKYLKYRSGFISEYIMQDNCGSKIDLIFSSRRNASRLRIHVDIIFYYCFITSYCEIQNLKELCLSR